MAKTTAPSYCKERRLPSSTLPAQGLSRFSNRQVNATDVKKTRETNVIPLGIPNRKSIKSAAQDLRKDLLSLCGDIGPSLAISVSNVVRLWRLSELLHTGIETEGGPIHKAKDGTAKPSPLVATYLSTVNSLQREAWRFERELKHVSGKRNGHKTKQVVNILESARRLSRGEQVEPELIEEEEDLS